MLNKKSLIIGLLILLGTTFSTLQAQNTSVGLRAGVNLSNRRGKNISNSKFKMGVNFGVLLTHNISSNFGITGEANFTQKGEKIPRNSDWKKIVNYLEIPLYGTYYLGTPNANLRPKVFVGAFLGMLITAKNKIDDFEDSFKNGRKIINAGTVFGIGIQKRIGNNNWFSIDLRYNLGLSNTDKKYELIGNNTLPIIIQPPFKPVQNNVFSLNLAYTIPLGSK